MITRPLISVIVPVFNVEDYLTKCIESILNQSYGEIELLLIDDGSTDKSGKICDDYSSHDPRVKVFHCKNGGVSRARNIGLKNCCGHYVSFVDADDWIDRDLFSYLLDDNYINVIDVFTFDSVNVHADGKSNKRNFWVSFSEKEIIKGKDAYREVFCKSAWITNKIFNKTIIKDIWFREDMTYAEDVFFLCQALKNANVICASNYSGYFRLVRVGMASGSVCYKRNNEYVLNNYLLYKELQKYKNGDVGIFRFYIVLTVIASKKELEKSDDIFKIIRKLLKKTSFKDRVRFYFSCHYGYRVKSYLFLFLNMHGLWKRVYIGKKYENSSIR